MEQNKPKQLSNHSLTGQFESVANQINQNLPRKQQVQPLPQQNQPNIASPNNYRPDDPIVAKLRKWLLIGLSALVGGSAVALIIWRIALKFIN